MAANKARSIVTLTTDFGGSSPYVAQMKGIMLSRNPGMKIVDVSHSIPAQDILTGAVVLDDVCRRFPAGSIHIAVVDPGVGTGRQVVYAMIGERHYVAPDNGLLTLVARRTPPEKIIALTNPMYFLPEVSATFHGRDIMAPVAAHLSLGLHPERLGTPQDSLVLMPIPIPTIQPQLISGAVLLVDSFGNVITNIAGEDLPQEELKGPCWVRCGEREACELVQTYGERPAGTMVALVGSSGRLELAVVNGNAAERLGVQRGEEVTVQW